MNDVVGANAWMCVYKSIYLGSLSFSSELVYIYEDIIDLETCQRKKRGTKVKVLRIYEITVWEDIID